MALQKQDPAFMRGMAKLPQELMDEVIRWTVKTEGVIDLSNLKRDVKALLAPFVEHESLLKVAKKEVFRVNVFRLSMSDTVLGSSQHVIYSVTSGKRISRSYLRKVERLEVHMPNELEGADFIDEYRVPARGLPDKTRTISSRLAKVCPRMRTLHVEIENQDHLRLQQLSADDAVDYWLPDGRMLSSTDPTSREWMEKEKIISMHELLLMLGAQHYPALREKTMAFVNGEGPSAAQVFDGQTFHDETEFELPYGYIIAEARELARRDYMVCKMMASPKTMVWYTPVYLAQEWLRAELAENGGRKDLETITEMLKFDRAVVNFPCRVVRKDDEESNGQ